MKPSLEIEEALEVQAEIIDAQTKLIKDLATALHINLDYNEEARRVEALKEKLG